MKRARRGESMMRLTALLVLLIAAIHRAAAWADQGVSFEQRADSLAIKIDGQPFGSYVWRDPEIRRPYFANLQAPGGIQVTRTHPPVEGRDAVDHATMHPGLWLAFGDISSADFWRNKGSVEHVDFVENPSVVKGEGKFTVRNRYVAAGKTICEEVCQILIAPVDHFGTVVGWESNFSGPDDFYFGDQEEMGLGVRVASPLAVKNGGQIVNSDGLMNEKQVWGKQADWCDYSGTIDGAQAGVMIVSHPKNFRRSWFHARDYGLLVANPFGQKAFTMGPPSNVVVRKGETLSLRFDVVIHRGALNAEAILKWLAASRASNPAKSD